MAHQDFADVLRAAKGQAPVIRPGQPVERHPRVRAVELLSDRPVLELRINEGEIEKLPIDVTLIPGMPVEAFVRTADRSPMDYLIKPLADYFAKAFRES